MTTLGSGLLSWATLYVYLADYNVQRCPEVRKQLAYKIEIEK